MPWNPALPYNDLPPLPPRESATGVDTREVLKAVPSARSALASLNEASKRISNPSLLLNNLTLLEAQASSEIENIVTTTDDLFRYASTELTDASESATPQTKETYAYRSALYKGMEAMEQRPLSADTAKIICSAIHGQDMQFRNYPGTFISSSKHGEPVYTPPEGVDTIMSLLSNWSAFIHRATPPSAHALRDPADYIDLDPLTVMAVAHYQFEAIHPFPDGNGRTGRILNILILKHFGLLEHPILYLSRSIIENKVEYYDRLLNVTKDGDWTGWILFMLEAVRSSAERTLTTIDAIVECRSTISDHLKEQSHRPDEDLLDLLIEQPYCRITAVAERCGVSRPTATKWLRDLSNAGVLREERVGRTVLFSNPGLMAALQR